jgi:hypothetical protein
MAIIIRNSVENGLFSIWMNISARYESIGHGKIGKKFPINHKIKTSIERIIRKISILVKN